MPCGLVYGVLAWSLAASGALAGAELMAAFGAGTLPALFAVGAANCWLGAMARAPMVRRTAGIVVMLLGVYALWAPDTSPHRHHAVHAATASVIVAPDLRLLPSR